MTTWSSLDPISIHTRAAASPTHSLTPRFHLPRRRLSRHSDVDGIPGLPRRGVRDRAREREKRERDWEREREHKCQRDRALEQERERQWERVRDQVRQQQYAYRKDCRSLSALVSE